MRLRIKFQFKEKLNVPVHHQELLHGLIYHCIGDDEFRDRLHNYGFPYEKRQFRMFCFSKLMGVHQFENGRIIFSSPVSFLFSSFHDRLVSELATTLFAKKELYIGHNRVTMAGIEVVDEKPSSVMHVRMITPVTMYSTLIENNRKKTYYYSPSEDKFSELIANNARKKYEAIYGNPAPESSLELVPLDLQKLRPKTVLFKGTIIKGWMGDFRLTGHPELLRIVHDVGIGAKCSNGMGLFTVVRDLNETKPQ
ncbi:CRISPR-associated endoribonuclease Cas6 [Paenibacillus elgii]|uniref:CRISPR-associated endoribonuclease Cas6 n=1 Tax=Paenibacillus elgii TaxID=189691 RepID=UPI000248D26D|nr:CRISPR-associated endoribonuclease Cas6 [Paenibacillus elgii]